MTKVKFVVEYRYYQYNSGMADNGEYIRHWPTKNASDAITLAEKINAMAKNLDDESQEREDLQEEMIPYSGYFISAQALKITSEPVQGIEE